VGLPEEARLVGFGSWGSKTSVFSGVCEAFLEQK
jgi:hypothetical protein